MRKKSILLLLCLLLAGIIAIGFGPSILRKMPTRYAMRLPEPLQALALPEENNPLLPTAAAPEAAADLLGEAVAPPVVTTASAPASPTPLPLAGSAANEQATVQPGHGAQAVLGVDEVGHLLRRYVAVFGVWP